MQLDAYDELYSLSTAAGLSKATQTCSNKGFQIAKKFQHLMNSTCASAWTPLRRPELSVCSVFFARRLSLPRESSLRAPRAGALNQTIIIIILLILILILILLTMMNDKNVTTTTTNHNNNHDINDNHNHTSKTEKGRQRSRGAGQRGGSRTEAQTDRPLRPEYQPAAMIMMILRLIMIILLRIIIIIT